MFMNVSDGSSAPGVAAAAGRLEITRNNWDDVETETSNSLERDCTNQHVKICFIGDAL